MMNSVMVHEQMSLDALRIEVCDGPLRIEVCDGPLPIAYRSL